MSAARNNLEARAQALATGPGYDDWKRFVDAFKEYTDSRRDECVSAPVEKLQVAQGGAQECVNLMRLFEGAVSAAARRATKRAE